MKDERKFQIVKVYFLDKLLGALIPMIIILISDWLVLDRSILASRLLNITAIILMMGFNLTSYFGIKKFFNDLEEDKKNKKEEEL